MDSFEMFPRMVTILFFIFWFVCVCVCECAIARSFISSTQQINANHEQIRLFIRSMCIICENVNLYWTFFFLSLLSSFVLLPNRMVVHVSCCLTAKKKIKQFNDLQTFNCIIFVSLVFVRSMFRMASNVQTIRSFVIAKHAFPRVH